MATTTERRTSKGTKGEFRNRDSLGRWTRGWRRPRQILYLAHVPPATGITAPLTYAPAREARYSAMPAMSGGVPSRLPNHCPGPEAGDGPGSLPDSGADHRASCPANRPARRTGNDTACDLAGHEGNRTGRDTANRPLGQTPSRTPSRSPIRTGHSPRICPRSCVPGYPPDRPGDYPGSDPRRYAVSHSNCLHFRLLAPVRAIDPRYTELYNEDDGASCV